MILFQTIGTSFSNSISESFGVDVTVEAALRSSFWGIFDSSLGFSVSTGYNWTHASDSTMSEQQTVEVKTTVAPGYLLQIQQAVGKCGSSNANTELFKIVHIEGETGQIVKEEFEHTLPDGKTVKISNPLYKKKL